MFGKRKLNECKDPDFPDVIENKRNKVILTGNERLEKIKAIVHREFQNELMRKEEEINTIEKKLWACKRLMHRVRYGIVSHYYAKPRNAAGGTATGTTTTGTNDNLDNISDTIGTGVQTTIGGGTKLLQSINNGDQFNVHPSLKKLLGKKPINYDEILSIRRPRQAAETARHSITERFVKKKEKKNKQLKMQKSKNGIIGETNNLTEDAIKVPRYIEPNVTPKVIHALNTSRGRNKTKHLIVVGNTSKYLVDEKSECTHKWLVYVQTKTEVPIEKFVSKVRFYLHPSFPNHIFDVESPPFVATRRGWGEFTLRVKLFFYSEFRQKPLQIIHELVLDKTHTGFQTRGAETLVELWLYSDENCAQKPVNDTQNGQREDLDNNNAEQQVNDEQFMNSLKLSTTATTSVQSLVTSTKTLTLSKPYTISSTNSIDSNVYSNKVNTAKSIRFATSLQQNVIHPAADNIFASIDDIFKEEKATIEKQKLLSTQSPPPATLPSPLPPPPLVKTTPISLIKNQLTTTTTTTTTIPTSSNKININLLDKTCKLIYLPSNFKVIKGNNNTITTTTTTSTPSSTIPLPTGSIVLNQQQKQITLQPYQNISSKQQQLILANQQTMLSRFLNNKNIKFIKTIPPQQQISTISTNLPTSFKPIYLMSTTNISNNNSAVTTTSPKFSTSISNVIPLKKISPLTSYNSTILSTQSMIPPPLKILTTTPTTTSTVSTTTVTTRPSLIKLISTSNMLTKQSNQQINASIPSQSSVPSTSTIIPISTITTQKNLFSINNSINKSFCMKDGKLYYFDKKLLEQINIKSKQESLLKSSTINQQQNNSLTLSTALSLNNLILKGSNSLTSTKLNLSSNLKDQQHQQSDLQSVVHQSAIQFDDRKSDNRKTQNKFTNQQLVRDYQHELEMIFSKICDFTTITTNSRMQYAVTFLLQRIPIISDKYASDIITYSKSFPFIVENETIFRSYRLPKQYCIEWLRAKMINRILKKYIPDTSGIWSTRTILMFSRKYGYSPIADYTNNSNNNRINLESQKKSRKNNNRNHKEQRDNDNQDDQLEFSISDHIQTINWINNYNEHTLKLRSIEEDETIIDVDGFGDEFSLLKHIKNEPSEMMDLNYMPFNYDLELQWITDMCSKFHIKLGREEIVEGVMHATGHMILAHVLRCFVNDLVRRTHASKSNDQQNNSVNSDSTSIEPNDIKTIISKQSRFDFLTKNILGFKETNECKQNL